MGIATDFFSMFVFLWGCCRCFKGVCRFFGIAANVSLVFVDFWDCSRCFFGVCLFFGIAADVFSMSVFLEGDVAADVFSVFVFFWDCSQVFRVFVVFCGLLLMFLWCLFFFFGIAAGGFFGNVAAVPSPSANAALGMGGAQIPRKTGFCGTWGVGVELGS